MSEYTDIKQDIDENITTNGRGEITPTKVRFVLKDSMIDGFNETKKDSVKKVTSIPTGGLLPDVFYFLTISSNTDITFAPAPEDGLLHQYMFAVMVNGSPTISLPASIEHWPNGNSPDFAPGMLYVISVIHGFGAMQSFDIE